MGLEGVHVPKKEADVVVGDVRPELASVAISGETVAVGTPCEADTTCAGSVHLVERDLGTWQVVQSIATPIEQFVDQFGSSLDLDGSVLLVGASWRWARQAYLFVREDGTWVRQQPVLEAEGEGGEFGRSVALDGNVVVVGAPLDSGADRFAGAVHAFGLEERIAAGQPCDTDDGCASRHCADGVCCDTACGGGRLDDCVACSVEAGSEKDGVCTVLAEAWVCRESSGVCDQAETCDGYGEACPADTAAPRGASCPGGACRQGVCEPDDATPKLEYAGGGCALGGQSGPAASGLAAVALGVVLGWRKRRT